MTRTHQISITTGDAPVTTKELINLLNRAINHASPSAIKELQECVVSIKDVKAKDDFYMVLAGEEFQLIQDE